MLQGKQQPQQKPQWPGTAQELSSGIFQPEIHFRCFFLGGAVLAEAGLFCQIIHSEGDLLLVESGKKTHITVASQDLLFGRCFFQPMLA